MKYRTGYHFSLRAFNKKYDILWHLNLNDNCIIRLRGHNKECRIVKLSSKVPEIFIQQLKTRTIKDDYFIEILDTIYDES